jgi:hypothetical protein
MRSGQRFVPMRWVENQAELMRDRTRQSAKALPARAMTAGMLEALVS